jgi:hypothetical protein
MGRAFMKSAALTRWPGTLVLLGLLAASEAQPGSFRTNDVIAFVGGAAIVDLEQAGHLETLLTVAHPSHRLRFRSLAWEGDTVFSRPRELNFPPLTELLARTHATVVVVQFGVMESFAGDTGLKGFEQAYDRLLDEIQGVVPRIILVTPLPFEPKSPPLPDLASRNGVLAGYANVARALAGARHLPLVDLFGALMSQPRIAAWTVDGQALSAEGQRIVAALWVRELGWPDLAQAAMEPGFWGREGVAGLQAAIRVKNRLWFESWRPTNWAFLHGDRTEQLSSRDHRDPKIRWFPSEMERYGQLITEAESRVESLAARPGLDGAGGGTRNRTGVLARAGRVRRPVVRLGAGRGSQTHPDTLRSRGTAVGGWQHGLSPTSPRRGAERSHHGSGGYRRRWTGGSTYHLCGGLAHSDGHRTWWRRRVCGGGDRIAALARP